MSDQASDLKDTNQLLQTKNTMPGMKKRLDTEEEKTDIPEDTAIETNSNKTKRGKELDRNKHSIYMLQDFFKVLKGKKKISVNPAHT